MNATKKYQFMGLLCMMIASVFTMVGMTFSLVYLVRNSYPLWILPLTICAFLGMFGQSKMIELFGEYLKGGL